MKLEKLTPEQEKHLATVRDEYISLAFSGKEIDKEEATSGIKWLYKFSNLREPIIIFLDSPMACQIGAEYAIQLLKNLKLLKKESQVRSQVRSQVGSQVGSQVQSQVWSQVRSQVGSQVWSQVQSQVWSQVQSQVGSQVRSQVWSQVQSQVQSQVGSQVEPQVGSQVWSQVWSQVQSQVGSQVRSQVKQSNIEFREFSSYGNIWDLGWLSFYTAFEDMGIDLGKSKEDFIKFRNLVESGVFNMIQLDGLCIVSSLPKYVKRNLRNDMHCENGAAIEFRDGYKQHYLNGVFFTEELYNKVIDPNFPFEERMKIVDVDQRTQAINPKFVDIEKFIKEAKGELLDEHNKYYIKLDNAYVSCDKDNPIAIKDNYKLYRFPKGNIFTEDAYYCYFDCPSTRKKHLEGVEVSKTVAEAMAWAEDITPDEWIKRIPLAQEN